MSFFAAQWKPKKLKLYHNRIHSRVFGLVFRARDHSKSVFITFMFSQRLQGPFLPALLRYSNIKLSRGGFYITMFEMSLRLRYQSILSFESLRIFPLELYRFFFFAQHLLVICLYLKESVVFRVPCFNLLRCKSLFGT